MDFTGKGLKAVPTPSERDAHRKLVLDENSLTKLKGIEEYRCLETLSVARNRLVRLPPSSFASLRNLRVLNLEQNSLFDVQGLSCLPMLEWLNLSGNSLKDFSGVKANVRLSHLDLSDNSISDLFDISQLRHLKALLLHGNVLTSIQKAPNCLPSCLCLLTLADNEIHDLTEFLTLTRLASSLANLTVANNPALLMTGQSMGFDYRPYFLSICPNLETLDGFTIADDERQRANHLFPPTTKSPYKLGQHRELVEYLSSLLPLTQARQLHQTGLRREKDDVLKLHQQHIEAQFLEYQDEQRQQLQRLFQQQEELLRQSRTSLATSSLNDTNATEIYVATAELTKSKSESTLVLEDLEDELADLHETSLLTSTSEYVPLPPGGQVFSPQKANSFANETENKHDAAIVIQSWVRGHQLRERLRPFVEETRAAVKIQAAWRGHRTRKRDPFVREMKREIRCKRTEAHLIHITQTLTDTQRELVKESQLRRRQEESIARLWDEVRSLNRKNDWNAAATCIQSAWRRYRTRKKKTVESSHVSLNDVSSQIGSLLEAVNDLESQVKGSEDTSLSFKLESDSASSISDGDGAVDSSPTDLKAAVASPLSLQNSGGSLSSSRSGKSPREKAEDLLSSLEHQLSQNNKLMTSTDSEGQQTPGSMCSFYSLPPKLAALATTSQSTASGTNQQ
ncbi:centrosomal protein of 97 kDa-like [Oscarella lobularis]|uniref:centrosomal protein of 97 kDa-like n=1 Tax=Oscarella lobularis TaxID=121494 RepID=UPI00331386EE